MHFKKTFQIAIIGALSLSLVSLTWASSDSRTFVLESTAKHLDASGTAVIDQAHVSIPT